MLLHSWSGKGCRILPTPRDLLAHCLFLVSTLKSQSLEKSSATQLQILLVLHGMSRLLLQKDWSCSHIPTLPSPLAHPRTGTGTEEAHGTENCLILLPSMSISQLQFGLELGLLI